MILYNGFECKNCSKHIIKHIIFNENKIHIKGGISFIVIIGGDWQQFKQTISSGFLYSIAVMTWMQHFWYPIVSFLMFQPMESVRNQTTNTKYHIAQIKFKLLVF